MSKEPDRDYSFYAASTFEQLARNLGLKPDGYESSVELKAWVFKNKDQKYVPSELLEAWGFVVDTAA
jgi:hypothetical protein